MSLVIPENKKIKEFKLKLANILHLINNIHAEIFPGTNPGFYNNALGHNRLKRWLKLRKKFNLIELKSLSILVTPAGIYVISQNHSDIFGWMFVLWGTLCTVLLFWEKHSSDEKRDEDFAQLKKDYEELKKKF